MKYNTNSHINTIKDVETFFHHIVFDRKVNFHPYDMFEDALTSGNNAKQRRKRKKTLF